MTSNPLVSIVTPVYNGANYLAECIESVIGQTYKNIEYIIVNNFSADQSLEIAEHYARRDDRIKIFNNDRFLNQIPNWNNALSRISSESEYCQVLMADDYLFPDFVRAKVEFGEDHPTVGIISSYRLNGTNVNRANIPLERTFVPGKEAGRMRLLKRSDAFGSPSSFLLRSRLVRSMDLVFDSEEIHADTDLVYRLLLKSDLGYIHQILSFTRLHEESTTTFCRAYATLSLSHLSFTKKYGRSFLNDSEGKDLFRRLLLNQHRAVASRLLGRGGLSVVKYHKRELSRIGRQFSWRVMVYALLIETLMTARAALKGNKRKVKRDVQLIKFKERTTL